MRVGGGTCWPLKLSFFAGVSESKVGMRVGSNSAGVLFKTTDLSGQLEGEPDLGV